MAAFSNLSRRSGLRNALLVTGIALLSACGFVGFPGVYKIDVEQGNIVTQDMADQLKPGMSRRQVRFILGTPLVEDPFNQSRWDYPYVKRNGDKVLDQARLTVIFDGDDLDRIEGDYLPERFEQDGFLQDEVEDVDETTTVIESSDG
ncbi:MAG: outer membrane protein assembly factor BamE [Pseudomonadota bacterium]